MKAIGIQHYRAQFASLHNFFPKITMQVYSISWSVKRKTQQAQSNRSAAICG